MSAIIVFFFNDTATTEIYTLSLHDALPIALLGAMPRPRVNVAIASRYCRTPDCATPSAMILSTLRGSAADALSARAIAPVSRCDRYSTPAGERYSTD